MNQYLDLEKIYNSISEAIAKLDFELLWEGFKPLKFALYNDDECYFNGHYIEKQSDFCANTAIEFQGELIAIWRVDEELNIPVFTSKIVHEMFHAFQKTQGWNCFPKEMEALYKYRYEEENLSLKLHENKLLLDLLDGYDQDKYKELLNCRKYRKEKFPYEFSYECSGEEIEGSANYVEWQVLKQLDNVDADNMIEEMRKVMLSPEYFFPIRISGYYTGALLINAMIQAKDYHYAPNDRPVIVQRLFSVSLINEVIGLNGDEREKVSLAIETFYQELKRIIETSVKNGEVILIGPYEMVSVNIYDARYYDGFLTSRFFLMYMDKGETKEIRNNCVIKMADEKTIEKVYRWVSE